MAKNYIKQFMEDNGLEVGKPFKIKAGLAVQSYDFVFDRWHQLYRFSGGELLKEYDDKSLCALLVGLWKVTKPEPKAKKIEKLPNIETMPFIINVKINEIIDAVNTINMKLEDE